MRWWLGTAEAILHAEACATFLESEVARALACSATLSRAQPIGDRMPPFRKFAFLMLLCGAARAQTTTASGEFTVEPATLVSLGFEWRITGDDNRNAKVETSYRKK